MVLKVLVTGFDPFGGEASNPSFEAIKLLPPQICGTEIVAIEIPTVFETSGHALEAAIALNRPNIVICVGQAGGNTAIAVERVAVNLRDASIPDNAGALPVDEPIRAGGPAAYFSTLPVKAIVGALRESGIPAYVSNSAGTYVCNNLMYTLLDLIHCKYPDMQGGFIHVPFSMEQAAMKTSGTASMELTQISRAIGIAIQTVVTALDIPIQN